MTDFRDLAELATATAHSLLGGGVATVTSADGSIIVADVNVVIEEDAVIETQSGTAIYGQTVISFDKAELDSLAVQRDVVVAVSGGKTYRVREIQTEDAWAITASATAQ